MLGIINCPLSLTQESSILCHHPQNCDRLTWQLADRAEPQILTVTSHTYLYPAENTSLASLCSQDEGETPRNGSKALYVLALLLSLQSHALAHISSSRCPTLTHFLGVSHICDASTKEDLPAYCYLC